MATTQEVMERLLKMTPQQIRDMQHVSGSGVAFPILTVNGKRDREESPKAKKLSHSIKK